MTTNDELWWAGGFWDGEGSICLNAHKNRPPTLQASLHQNDRGVLDRFLAAIGTGKIYGPYGPYPDKPRSVNPFYQWATAGSRKVPEFYELICPYISQFKREQGEVAIAQYKELNNNDD